MRKTRNPSNCLVIIVSFFASVAVFIILNILNSSIGSDQFQDTDKENTKYLYSIQPLSSTELYYLDKHGYRIALQSEGTADFTTKIHRSPSTQPLPTEPPLNGYDVMHGENEAERDETIDYNLNLHETTNQDDILTQRPKCNEKNPVKKLVLLKTHRTGSSTLANILYRYGDLNNHDFALPKGHSYEYYWPVPFNPSFIDKQYMNSSRSPDMLVNARLRTNSMALWKSQGAFLITVIRNPTSQFESSFYSNHLDNLFGLEKTSNPLAEFLKSSKELFSYYIQNAEKIDTKLNLAVNGQMYDLGLKRIHFSDENVINKTIEELNDTINLVLISEYMDESLILLKRALCWDIDDVLYFAHKQRHVDYKELDVTSNMAEQIYEWNQADVFLYKYFNQTLWERIGQQDSTFYDELQELKLKRQTLKKECLASSSIDQRTGEIVFKLEPNLSSFNKYLCEKMNMNEQDYIAYLKTKARLKFQQEDVYIKKKFQEIESKMYNLSTMQRNL